MKYFFDTEFMEDGRTIDLLSIGIVAEDGRELYLEDETADHSKANDFVRRHVLPHLGKDPAALCSPRAVIRDAVRNFVGDDPYPQFWAYYADYDWVVLCQLFGRMVDLPELFPKWCCDLKQHMHERDLTTMTFPSTGAGTRPHRTCLVDRRQAGDDLLPGFKTVAEFEMPGFREHNALWDARWCMKLYQAAQAFVR